MKLIQYSLRNWFRCWSIAMGLLLISCSLTPLPSILQSPTPAQFMTAYPVSTTTPAIFSIPSVTPASLILATPVFTQLNQLELLMNTDLPHNWVNSQNAGAFSPDNKQIAFTYGGLKLIQISTGEELWDFNESVSPNSSKLNGLRVATFSPDGRLIATGGNDGVIYLLDSSNGHKLGKVQHPDAVLTLNFNGNGKKLIASGCGEKPSTTIWDLSEDHFQLINTFNSLAACKLVVSPDGETVAIPGNGITLLNLMSGETKNIFSDLIFYDVAFSTNDNLLLAISNSSSQLLFIDLANLSISEKKLDWEKYQSDLISLDISSSNVVALSGFSGNHSMVVLWNLNSLTPLSKLEFNDSTSIVLANFSRDGKLLATASIDLPLKIWDVSP